MNMTDNQRNKLRLAAQANADLAKRLTDIAQYLYPIANSNMIRECAKELATNCKAQLKIIGEPDA